LIPQSFIQDLLARVDIVDVIDRHVKLKRAGANHVACCPFHSEKSPSFTVSQPKQFYHCFGCGAHGTAIGFLMEYSGLTFPDAVRELAQTVGMTVPEVASDSGLRRSEGQDLHAVLLEAARFYRAQLKASPVAIDYLKRRGLSGEIAKTFGIGYAADAWQGLQTAFPDYGARELAAAGLVKVNEDGKRYDVFRDRIMFPIVDVRGNVVGFGGRVLKDQPGAPKYLNSPETPVFEKGRELYGLYQARRAIRDAGRVLVVEGYMDVVALAQNGVGYAVATLGTATTAIHVQKLLRQTDEIVYGFDGDDAGRRAAWRALENSLSQLADGKRISFLFLPQGEDPDSYIRQHGQAAFEALLDKGLPLSRYFFEHLTANLDLATAEGRAGLLHAARPLLKQIPPNGFRAQLVVELAERVRLAVAEVETQCEIAPMRTQPAARVAGPRRAAPSSLVRKLLELILSHPGVAARITAGQRELMAGDPDSEPVLLLLDTAMQNGAVTTAALMEALRGSRHAELYREIAGAALVEGADEDAALADLPGIFAQLERKSIIGELGVLNSVAVKTPAERERHQQLSRRLAELHGVPAVRPGSAAQANSISP